MYTQTQQVQRIQSIQNTLRASIYHGKKRVESILGSRVCFRRLSYGEREKTLEDCAGWENYESGRLWGGSDQHFAFRAQFEIPKEYEAKEVVLQVSTGATDIWNTDNPQFIIYKWQRMLCDGYES